MDKEEIYIGAFIFHIGWMVFVGIIALYLWNVARKKDKKEKYDRRDN